CAPEFLVRYGTLPYCSRSPGVQVFLAEFGLGWAPFHGDSSDAVGEPPGDQEESSVGHHAVVRAHCESFKVPAAHHGFPGIRLGEASVTPYGLGGWGKLRHCCHVVDPDATWGQNSCHSVKALPGSKHVQHYTVYG